MKELIARLSNESPKFFKKVQVIGASCILIGGALMAAPAMPAIILTIAGHLITGGTVATIVGKFAVSDNSVLPTKEQPK